MALLAVAVTVTIACTSHGPARPPQSRNAGWPRRRPSDKALRAAASRFRLAHRRRVEQMDEAARRDAEALREAFATAADDDDDEEVPIVGGGIDVEFGPASDDEEGRGAGSAR